MFAAPIAEGAGYTRDRSGWRGEDDEMITALMWAAAAHAFCGTYVGDGSQTLLNKGSQIAISRQGGRTTITMASDYDGPLQDFAMLVPVPVVLGEEDVRIADPALMNRLDAYSAPRLVRYTCDDFYYDDMAYDNSAVGCGNKDYALTQADSAGSVGDIGLDVTIENQFEVGVYEIVILSSEDSGDLMIWLEREGYAVSADAEAMLADYIEQDVYFFAAKVTLGEVDEALPWLEPLQFSYEADALSLPIRLGTLNSPGEQDLVIYVVNADSQGAAGISNYPELVVEDECMWEPSSPEQSIGDHYDEAFGDAWDGGAGWSREFSWNAASCDPCPDGGSLTDKDVSDLGFNGSAAEAHFTRLHVRYTPEAASQDLMLYLSGQGGQDQVRFIEYLEDLEDRFPICGEGWVADDEAGTCSDAPEEDGSDRTGRAALVFAALSVTFLARRRRR
ncbi:MAG: hypothetical protein ACI8S6_005669 [Myxococcota bacterium]|jgi:hypothetical protein